MSSTDTIDPQPKDSSGGHLLPTEFELGGLQRRALQTIAILAALVLIALLTPGLGEVRDRLANAAPGWIVLAIVFEGLSFASYVLMFGPIFCNGLSWRRSWQIGGSELAMGSIIPASGAGGLALGAWVLHEGGMSADRIARRSVAFFLIKSSVNFFAVAILGLLLWSGIVGPNLSFLLTGLPAIMALLAIAAVFAIPKLGPGEEPGESVGKFGRGAHLARKALIEGSAESIAIIRVGDLRVITGAIGYWAFDNAVLWATFHAFGIAPPIMVVLMGYLIGQLGGLLPIPGGIGGIDGGLIGTLVVYGTPAALTAAAVLGYRLILFWLPLLAGGVAFASLRRNMPAEGELIPCAQADLGRSPSGASSG